MQLLNNAQDFFHVFTAIIGFGLVDEHAFFFVGDDGNAGGFSGLNAEKRIFNRYGVLGLYA